MNKISYYGSDRIHLRGSGRRDAGNTFKRGTLLYTAIIILSLLAVYLIVNVVFPLLPLDIMLETYVMQPFLWILVVVGVRLMPAYRTQAKIRTINNYVWLGMGIGFLQIILDIIGGLFSGFGRNPASQTPLGISGTILYTGTMLVGMELSRAWLASRLARQHLFIAVALIGALFTLLSIPVNQVTGFFPGAQSTNVIISSWLPLLSENLLATVLVFSAGARASLAYRGLLAAFWWLSPVLPDLSWVFKGLLGTAVPIIGILAVNKYYAESSNRARIKYRKQNAAIPIGWIVTALACVIIVWFATGVFPFKPSVVGSGSMSPVLQTGDMVIIAKVSVGKIKVGDIIEYRKDQATNVIHRIIGITSSSGNLTFITKGDANNVADENPVRTDQILGKVLFEIPKVGWVSFWVKRFFQS